MVPNGLMNERETVLAGERLTWIPAPQDTVPQGVILEAVDHCQVVSRTWNPQFSEEGWPLLLNNFTHASSYSFHQSLALPMPCTWTPRQDRDPLWENLGSERCRPEYWLPKLKPPIKRQQK